MEWRKKHVLANSFWGKREARDARGIVCFFVLVVGCWVSRMFDGYWEHLRCFNQAARKERKKKERKKKRELTLSIHLIINFHWPFLLSILIPIPILILILIPSEMSTYILPYIHTYIHTLHPYSPHTQTCTAKSPKKKKKKGL